jgi:periplasmic protein TonB
MFADSILDVSWAQRSRRSWTTLTSIALQALAIGVLLLISLLETVQVPGPLVVSTPISLGRPEPAPRSPRPDVQRRGITQIILHPGQIFMPHTFPRQPYEGSDAGDATPAPDVGYLEGGPGGNGPALPLPSSGTHPVPPPPALPKPKPESVFRTSKFLEGMLVSRPQPVYPPLARAVRIQGSVVLAAVVSKDGTIKNLHALSGHPMLIPAAIDAVSQWRYRPYILNGEPIEVETQITVNFSLSGN